MSPARLSQTQRLAARLQAAVKTRGVIDRAVGILLNRSGGTEEEALNQLRTLSQHEHHRLSVVASRIVDEAVAAPEPGKDPTNSPGAISTIDTSSIDGG
jgi:AmiR/NasT family two-component response regulator